MNALQKIIAEAKSLKKKFPNRFATWKEYVKQASAMYASKHKGKSPVGKKKKAVGKTGEYHKDTKSHNVNIKVVSGVKNKKIGENLSKEEKFKLQKKYTDKFGTDIYLIPLDITHVYITYDKPYEKGAMYQFSVYHIDQLKDQPFYKEAKLWLENIFGSKKKGLYKIIEGHDWQFNRPLYQVVGVDNDYVGEWHIKKIDAVKELKMLGYPADTSLTGWRKGGTAIIEAWEKKLPKFKNVRVTRIKKGSAYSKPGTFRNFATLSGYFDTSVIKDIDSLKKEFYKLAKKYHPDAGGTNIEMQQLNAEYDRLFNALLKGSTLSQEDQNNEIVIDQAIREVIDSIISLENINIEIIGKWLWVSGNTYPVKDALKKAGLVFIKKEGVPYWVYKGVPSGSRGGTAMEDIKKKYGSQTVMQKPKGKITGISIVKKQKLINALKKLKTALNKR